MKAMVLKGICGLEENKRPLSLQMSGSAEREVLIKVTACGICHTELDEIEGRTAPPRFQVVPDIVGRVESPGKAVRKLRVGERVGVGWIHSACGNCKFCLGGNENLCDQFEATGRDCHGGMPSMQLRPNAYPIPNLFPMWSRFSVPAQSVIDRCGADEHEGRR